MTTILTARDARLMMPQSKYQKSVNAILLMVSHAAKQGLNSLPLTYGDDDYGIVDRKEWKSPGTTQIGLVIQELKRLGYHVTEANPTGTDLAIFW